MPQIMRNRACHAANGCEPFRAQKFLLAFAQAAAHALEGRSDFGDFIVGANGKRNVVKLYNY